MKSVYKVFMTIEVEVDVEASSAKQAEEQAEYDLSQLLGPVMEYSSIDTWASWSKEL